MTFVKVANSFPPGEKANAKVKGKDVMIVNLDEKYYALDNKCTHRGCKLSNGVLKGGNIECPCHGSIFDIKTGKVIKGPAKNPATSFKVKVQGEEILIDI